MARQEGGIKISTPAPPQFLPALGDVSLEIRVVANSGKSLLSLATNRQGWCDHEYMTVILGTHKDARLTGKSETDLWGLPASKSSQMQLQVQRETVSIKK